MRIRPPWIIFWISCLAALIAGGAWRTFDAQNADNRRGIELATRQADLPYKLPLAGVNVELTHYANLNSELDHIAELGFVWLRQPFLWSEIEPEQGQFEWEQYDQIVEAVAAYDGKLKLVAVLDGTPAWARHRDAPEHPFAPPESPAALGEFARALAERYGDRLDFYQIWDEPNIEGHWGNLHPHPALYVAMLDAAYHAIHTADSDATVIAAALAPNVETGPNNINDPDYLRAIYDLGGGDSFDAAAGKPYGFDTSPDDRTVDPKVLNFSRLILLREIMLEHGDADKPLWGSNFGWNTLPDDWKGTPSIWGSVTAEQQIEYTRRAYQRAQSEWAWLGGLIVQHWQPNAASDDPIQGFAIASHLTAWREVAPAADHMTSGRYPAINPFATYAGDWQFGDLGADGGAEAEQNTISVPFEGTEFALSVRRGDYLAYLLVSVDGKPANALPRNNDGEAFIALTSEKRDPVIDLILAAENLPIGAHTALITMRPGLGDDQWSIAGFAAASVPQIDDKPRKAAQAVFGFALLGILMSASRLPWGRLKLPSAAGLRNVGDFLLGLFFSAVVMVGTLLTWQDALVSALRRDLPAILVTLGTSSLLYFAPSTWIAFLALMVTAVIIFSRPWLGVLQVVFWSAFFTSAIDPFFRAIALVEAFLVITLVASAARWLYDHARQEKSLPQRLQTIRIYPLDVCMMAFALLGVLSLTWSELLPEALRELRVMLIEPALLYFLIRWQNPDEDDLAFLADALIFTGFMLAAIGLVTYFSNENVVIAEGGTRRLLSVYGSPNAVGLMLGRCLPFAFAYVIVPVGEWRRLLAGVGGVTMLLAVALSQSVGAILLGLPAALVVMLIAWRGRRALPYVASVGIAGLAALFPLARFLPRLRQITDFENNTTVFRLNLWRSTFQMLEDHPLTGVGLDQFLYQYRSRYILPEAWEDPNLSHPHNLLLDYWVRLGILGVVLAGASQWFFWGQALRVYRAVRGVNPLRFALILGVMGAMADFLAHGLVDMAHFNINLSFVFALLLALAVQLMPNDEPA